MEGFYGINKKTMAAAAGPGLKEEHQELHCSVVRYR